MVVCDMSGAELRILAELSGDPVWIEAFEKGWDVHSIGAEMLDPEEWKRGADYWFDCPDCGNTYRAQSAGNPFQPCAYCTCEDAVRREVACEFALKKDAKKEFPTMNQFVCTICSRKRPKTGRNQKYCEACRATANRAHIDENRRRKGVRVGIGSGANQPKGDKHPAYKNGISGFAAFRKVARQTIRYCQRCRKDLHNAKSAEWAVHHRDHDRANNTPENFELLCKRCHQLEHDCAAQFPALERRSPHRPNNPNAVDVAASAIGSD